MPDSRRRIHMLDEIRGFAIICMIIHHSFLDVGDVLGLEWGYKVFDALCIVQPLFWAIFIIISGMCSRLSRNTLKRGIVVLVCGGIITLVTALIMPILGFEGAEIYFGILHCLGICMIITGILMPLINKIDFRIGAAISIILFAVSYGLENRHILFGLIDLPDRLYSLNIFAPLGFHNTSFYSADYFPIIPWIFMFLFGAFIGKFALDDNLPEGMYKKRSKFLSFTGRNSLWVYLAHQPVIYAVMLIVSLIMGL